MSMTTDERELRRDLAARLDRDIVILKNYGWLIDHGHRIDRDCGTIVDPDGGGGYAIACLAEEGFTPATRGCLIVDHIPNERPRMNRYAAERSVAPSRR